MSSRVLHTRWRNSRILEYEGISKYLVLIPNNQKEVTMQEIKIKSHFTDWHTVTKEQAKRYAIFLLKNITTMTGKELEKYIEKNKIKGMTLKELLED